MTDDGWARWMRDHNIPADGGYSQRERMAREMAEQRKRREEFQRQMAHAQAQQRLDRLCETVRDAIAGATGDAFSLAVKILARGHSHGPRITQQMRHIHVLRAKLLRALETLGRKDDERGRADTQQSSEHDRGSDRAGEWENDEQRRD